MNFTTKVTESGKRQLQTGKITEPAKRENLSLVRCLGSEEVICLGSKGVIEEALTKNENWNPLSKIRAEGWCAFEGRYYACSEKCWPF